MMLQNVKKSTIIRTIAVIIVILNIILERCGVDIINMTEYEIGMVVEVIIEIAVILVGFWKNNSFSPKAIKADEFLQQLRDEEVESEVE